MSAPAQDIALRCQCGTVTGTAKQLRRGDYHHLVCYCDDCQAYARFLGQEQRMLDPWGGTHVVQIAPAQLHIETGHPSIRCVRLSAKGARRFYACCCNTPIGNTQGPQLPFVGIPSIALADVQLLDPASTYAMGKYAKSGAPSHIHPSLPLASMVLMARLLFRWWRTGRGSPSPYYERGEPVSAATILDERERAALYT